MVPFSNFKCADIRFMYCSVDGKTRAAQRLYHERFLQRRVPEVNVIVENLTRNSHHPNGRAKHKLHRADVDSLNLDYFKVERTTVIRRISEQMNLST